MSETNENRRAQLDAGVAVMMALPKDEREEFARQFRVSMGFESRYRSYKPGWRAALWNWIINADRTR